MTIKHFFQDQFMEKFDLRFRIVEEVSAVVRRVAKRCCNRRAGHCVLGPQHYSTAPDACSLVSTHVLTSGQPRV